MVKQELLMASAAMATAEEQPLQATAAKNGMHVHGSGDIWTSGLFHVPPTLLSAI